MKAGRFLLVAAVAAVLAGLVVAFPGTDRPSPARWERPAVPTARAGGVVSQTWYCAASTALTPSPPAHQVVLSNPTAQEVTVRVTPFGPEGPGPAAEVAVPALTPLAVDVAERFGSPSQSVLVESPVGELVVAHSLATDTAAESAPCATTPSGRWWFPALSTIRGAGTQLSLFNPFPSDAGVDVEVYLEDGVRLPTPLTGIVVPAGTVRTVDVGQVVQRRDQFAVVVRARSGRVVAEATQSFDTPDGPRGLRMYLGVPAPARRWALAGGFTGEGVSESLVVLNPGPDRLGVLIQVTPYGGSAAAPEPIEVEVPGLRYAVVDLSAEGRIPGQGYHSILVDSPDGAVVVARATTITAGPAEPPPDAAAGSTRPALTRGVAIGTGSPVGALEWLVPALVPSASPAPAVLIHNPDDGIAVVSLSAVGGGASSGFDGAEVEVAPRDSVVVTVPATEGVDRVAVRVSSRSPVVVEQLPTFPRADDLAFNLAVPILSGGGSVVRLAPT